MLTWSEWMEVLGDVYRNGAADGKRGAYIELLEQVSGAECLSLGGTLRRGIQEALEDATAVTESLWHD